MQMLSAGKIFFHLNEILKKILDNSAFLRYNIHARRDAGIAQSVEQLICNQQVGGSSPSTSSTQFHIVHMGEFPSGQWGQTVNLLRDRFGGSNPPSPTKAE